MTLGFLMSTCTPSLAPKHEEMMPRVKALKPVAQRRSAEVSPRRAAATTEAIGSLCVAQMALHTRQKTT